MKAMKKSLSILLTVLLLAFYITTAFAAPATTFICMRAQERSTTSDFDSPRMH
ncbi:MAG: hypothetical protein IKN72_00585 [Clostridia bacterium]|nr:hypothetical protein [Clostridia bacterium]